MHRIMCRAKIHRATINEADLNYVGSMTIPKDIMETLDILDGEKCDVLNINTGDRWTTYAITGDKPNYYCLNGAAARLGQPGDLIIIIFYAQMDEAEARAYRPKIAVMNPDNSVAELLPKD